MMAPQTMRRATGAALVLLLGAAAPASASWSIVAVDQATGQVAVASAACVSQAAISQIPARDLMDIQAVVVPGKGVAVVQGAADRARQSQDTIYSALVRGDAPADVLAMLAASAESPYRQFAIVDLRGRAAASTGSGVGAAAGTRAGQVSGTGIYFSAQGDQLPGVAVVEAAAAAMSTTGTLADRLMAALEAGAAAGGDRRCSSAASAWPAAPATPRTSRIAYLVAADASDSTPADGAPPRFAVSLSVTDQDTLAGDVDAVKTLRLRYDAWKKAHSQ